MIEELKKLYDKLKACDIKMLLHAEDCAYNQFTQDIKIRQKYLDSIQGILFLLSGDMSEADLSLLRESHLNALSRGRKIVAVITDLRNKSKEDMWRCASQQNGHAIYQKLPSKRRISV